MSEFTQSRVVGKALIAIVLVVSLWEAAASRTQSREPSFSYSLEAERVVLHEPAIITFSARNDSSQQVRIDLGNDRKGSFLFVVTSPDGKEISLPRFYREGFSRTGVISIDPGEDYKQRLVLSQWNDFDMIGKYRVEVRLTEPIRTGGGRVVGAVAPFSATLEILPRDPLRLKEVCESLVRRTYAAASYEAAAEAAHELSYVRDPIAVPYLAAVFHAGRKVERQAVDGLRRVANREAVEILISALGRGPSEKWADKESMAAGALGMIALETPDPKVKERIRRAFIRLGLESPIEPQAARPL